MKNRTIIFGLLLALGATGCSSSFYREASYASDDLYGLHDRTSIAQEQQARAEARKAEAEARRMSESIGAPSVGCSESSET